MTLMRRRSCSENAHDTNDRDGQAEFGHDKASQALEKRKNGAFFRGACVKEKKRQELVSVPCRDAEDHKKKEQLEAEEPSIIGGDQRRKTSDDETGIDDPCRDQNSDGDEA